MVSQGSKFNFEIGSTCATRYKFVGALLKILGAQLIMLGAGVITHEFLGAQPKI